MPRVKKVAINENPQSEAPVNPVPAAELAEPKKRASRAKTKPTRDELIKMLSDSSNEIKQIIQELKEDETRINGMGLKKLPELVKETIQNMEEDKQEIDDKYKELMECPDKTE